METTPRFLLCVFVVVFSAICSSLSVCLVELCLFLLQVYFILLFLRASRRCSLCHRITRRYLLHDLNFEIENAVNLGLLKV